MTAFRFFLILVIFALAAFAWFFLGGTLEYRTASLSDSLNQEMNAHWGPSALIQAPPSVLQADDTSLQPTRSDIRVAFDHTNRYMGLLWFSTYTVRFSATYTVPSAGGGTFVFQFPKNGPVPENLRVLHGDTPVEADPLSPEVRIPLSTDAPEATVTVEYQMRGRNRWSYGGADGAPQSGRASFLSILDDPNQASDVSASPIRLKNFTLTATTNFTDIDYTKGSKLPDAPAEVVDGGMKAVWQCPDLATRQRIGIEMPGRQNAGPIAARMAFYAPVSLFFFFTVLFTIVLLKKIPLHPMHYLFIAAGFFAFHILMAYLVDKIGLHETFWICAATSVLLVVTYMRLVAGAKFALLYVGLAQLVYLVGFSYAFFWTGWTGLTIVIVAIVTLFILMQTTGRVDWNAVFRKSPPTGPTADGAWHRVPPAPGQTPPGPTTKA